MSRDNARTTLFDSPNGYRYREFDTRAGSFDLTIPQLRHGSYFPEYGC